MSTLSEQVRELEERLDAAVQRAVKAERQIPALLDGVAAAESRLAQARKQEFVDGAVWYARWGAALSEAQALIVRHQAEQEFARRYPAVPEANHPEIPESSRPTPTPDPMVIRVDDGLPSSITITPSMARRLVSLAAQDGGSVTNG